MKAEGRKLVQRVIAIILVVLGIGVSAYFVIICQGPAWKVVIGTAVAVFMLGAGVFLLADPVPWFSRRLIGDTSGDKLVSWPKPFPGPGFTFLWKVPKFCRPAETREFAPIMLRLREDFSSPHVLPSLLNEMQNVM